MAFQKSNLMMINFEKSGHPKAFDKQLSQC
jgi:hypothetical protein